MSIHLRHGSIARLLHVLYICSEQEGGEGDGLVLSTPNFTHFDDLGRSTEGSRDTCLTLTQQIKTAMAEVWGTELLIITIVCVCVYLMCSFQTMWVYYGG